MHMGMKAAVLGGLVVVLASGGDADASQKLSASEIKALFPGQYVAVWKDKRRVQIQAGNNGEVYGVMGVLYDTGRWWIDGDQLCLSFRWWTANEPRCSEVLRDGAWYLGMIRSNGRPRLRFRPQQHAE